MRFRWIILSLLLMSCAVESRAQSADTSQPSYQDLLVRLRMGDQDIDFGELRRAFTRTEFFSPLGSLTRELGPAMFARLNDGAYEEALSVADTILRREFISIDAHMAAMVAAEELGDTARSEFHREMVVGLVESIESSGRGTDTASPYIVISVDEEAALMRARGLYPRAQAMGTCGGRPCDRMEAMDGKGNPLTFYFDTTIPMQVLSRRVKEQGTVGGESKP